MIAYRECTEFDLRSQSISDEAKLLLKGKKK